MFKINKSNEKAITLIVLVITIIVLLILAGISISMLSGDNSILGRTATARENTGTTQIKERIRLAYTGALTNGNGTISQESLEAELTKEFGANGYSIDDAEDTNGKAAWKVTVDGIDELITQPSNLAGGGNDTLQVNIEEIETESRAVILRATETSSSPAPTEAELQALDESKKQEMFLVAYNISHPGTTWDDFKEWYRDDITAEEVYAGEEAEGYITGYTSVYDFIIKTGAYNTPTTFVCNGETITGVQADFVATKNGQYTITASKDGKTGTGTITTAKCTTNGMEEKFQYPSTGQTTNFELIQDTYKAVIPVGYAYGTSPNVGTISKGLVITDAIDGQGNSTGNEFVWIPVDKANLTVGNTEKAMATNIGTNENPNYRGVLYNFGYFDSNNNYTWTAYSEPQQIQQIESAREPAYLIDSSYGDASSYNTAGIQTNTMQDEYNAMIASIKQYGGFYVGRYEMGKETNYSKIAVEPTSAAESETSSWYGLYSKAKTYTNSKNSVTAEMIWGSQYDAMLNFALTNSSDSAKVNANTNGNHSEKLLKTGIWLGESSKTDKINNIFDLEGNMFEWTKEAYNINYRVSRGGDCNGTGAPSRRDNYDPVDTNVHLGSRLGLYIK